MNGIELGLLTAIAMVMALFDAVIVKWGAEARTRTSAGVVLFLAFMMIAMIFGAFLYFSSPSSSSLVEALWVSSAAMSLSVFPLVYLFVREAARQMREGATFAPARIEHRRWFGLTVVASLVLNEFLMGVTFQLASGLSAPATGGAVSWIAFAVNSPWFLFPMSIEMIAAAILLRSHLPSGIRIIMIAQSTLMVLAPPVSQNPNWVWFSTVLGSAVMIGIVIYLMEYIYRHRQLVPAFSSYVLALMGVFGIMMAGLYVWLVYGEGFVFAVAVLLEMSIFFEAILAPDRFGEAPAAPWQLRPNWAFGLLAFIFVAELFMGAALDVVLLPGAYLGAFPTLPLAGGSATLLYNAFYNGFWFLAGVSGSTWFLGMMGIEMGALVVFKIRESISRENKIRMALMLGSYAIFATFFPSVYYSNLFPNALSGTQVPVLGWSMGLGSAPIVPSLFLVIFLTYIIFAVTAVLFGRRVVCSVFCTAPVMYQGTTIDTMKSFNRSSGIGHKYLGSRLSSLYSATAGVTMAALVGVSFASYFDQQGILNVSILGQDPSVFLFDLSFSVGWYILFVTIPYVGNYNCVTMGWCYTGLISGAFQKLGFFKLKVRSKEVCRTCTTVDCTKGCPVGLVDMPGHFRTKGEFRSTKCCGVGECVEACPYGNLYISDVRHWVRRRLGRPEVSPTATRRMAGTAPSISATSPALRSASTGPPYGLRPLPMFDGRSPPLDR